MNRPLVSKLRFSARGKKEARLPARLRLFRIKRTNPRERSFADDQSSKYLQSDSSVVSPFGVRCDGGPTRGAPSCPWVPVLGPVRGDDVLPTRPSTLVAG